MKKAIALIGVPSSTGAHWLGQEKTPQYLREVGLVAYFENVDAITFINGLTKALL